EERGPHDDPREKVLGGPRRRLGRQVGSPRGCRRHRRPGGVELHGAHSVKAFLRSMTMRATALTAKVSTNSTSPAAMYAPVFCGLSNSLAPPAIFEAKVEPPLKIDQLHSAVEF